MRGKTFFLDQGETLGGAERFLLDFFHSLNSAEVRQMRPVVLGAKSECYRELLPERIERMDFEFPSVRGGIFKKVVVLFRLLSAARKLKKIATKEGANIFFSNTPRTHFVLFLAKKFFFLRGKWIVMNHDFTVPKFLLRKIGKSADVVIANSLPCREHLRKILRKKDFGKIKIIENGIDLSALPSSTPPTQIQTFLMLGRIDPRKGQQYAVEAADLLQERNPDLRFFIVGSSFAEDERTVWYEHKIENFVRERNLTNVQFISEVSDPFAAIAEADCVLVLPTEPETFGRIVIEALALGKLVLAFDETGPREILKSFAHDLKLVSVPLLVERKNSMSLAESIGRFADHPEEALPFTQKSRSFVAKHFSLAETKKRLLSVILEK